MKQWQSFIQHQGSFIVLIWYYVEISGGVLGGKLCREDHQLGV